MKKPRKSRATTNNDFLRMAYCGLVLRGHNGARDIPDPILKEVWKRGRKLMRASSHTNPKNVVQP